MVRGVGGSCTHPDSVQFVQLVRLLSLCSLVKPPKGSNISGADLLDSLVKVKDVKSDGQQTRQKLLDDQLDKLLDGVEEMHYIPDVLEDHNYWLNGDQINQYAMNYISGYIARKAQV